MQTRLIRLAIALGTLLALFLGAGVLCWAVLGTVPWRGLTLAWMAANSGAVLWAALRHRTGLWLLARRLKTLLPAGPDYARLAAAVAAALKNQEEHALFLLEDYVPRADTVAVWDTARWIRALAIAHLMARQPPGLPQVLLPLPYPGIWALIVCGDPAHTAINHELLQAELRAVSPRELDAIALAYLRLVGILIGALERWNAPLGMVAEPLLEFLTGQVRWIGCRRKLDQWKERTHRTLIRGGGALLTGMRLMQRRGYAEADEFLTRLAQGGLLSGEADCVRRTAAFLALFAQPQWRLTSSDLPGYFDRGMFYMALEMGVLRYPTAELPEVVAACRNRRVLLENKRRLIEDVLNLWERFGEELGVHLDVALRRLLQTRPGRTPQSLRYWRALWNARKGTFERAALQMMAGILAVQSRRYGLALQLFQAAARRVPRSASPLVNCVHVQLALGQSETARKQAAEIARRFSRDGPSLIALGRLISLHLQDNAAAEKLFRAAAGPGDAPLEALTCLGELKLMEGAYSESQEFFTQASRLDPSLPDPKLGLARIFLETQNFERAIEVLQNVARQGPPEACHLAHYLLYCAHRETGDHRRAVAMLERIPPAFFKEPELLEDIATHLEGEQFYAKAREYSEQAMALRAARENVSEDGDTLNAR